MNKIDRLGAAMAVALTGSLIAPAPSAAMQQQDQAPRIVGVVIDQTSGHPVRDARVVLDDGRETRTGPQGLFQFDSPRPGARRIAALTTGCRAAGGSFRVEPGKDALLRLVLDSSSPVMTTTDVEKSGSAVRVIPGERLRDMSTMSLREAVRREVPGFLDGGRRNSLEGTRPLLIVDGTRIAQNVDQVLSGIRADHAVRVEIVRGSSATLEHGDAAANGLVRVHMRLGYDALDPGQPVESCTVDWGEL